MVYLVNFAVRLEEASPFLTGWQVTTLGLSICAASTAALIYLLGLLVLFIALEGKGHRLPDELLT